MLPFDTKDSVHGADIPFTASINSAKKVITIDPVSDFSSGQTAYVAIGATVEDSFDNAISAISSTFTIIDNAAPTFVNPADTDVNVDTGSNIMITFNEAVKISTTQSTDPMLIV